MPAERTLRAGRHGRPAAAAAALTAPAVRDGAATGGASVLALLVEAQRRLKVGDARAAERACRKIIRLAPDHPDALSLLSAALGRLGRPAEGEAFSRRALATRPHDPGLRLNLANRLREQGRLGEAIEAYREAHARAPTDGRVLRALLRALFAAGRGDEARDLAEGLAADDGGRHTDAETLAACAEIVLAEGDPPLALRLYRSAVGREPDRTDWWLQVTRLAMRLEDLNLAVAAAERVLEREPDHAEAKIMLAAALLRGREFSRVAAILDTVAAAGGVHAANAANLAGMMLVAQGRIAEGLAAMRPARELAPNAATLQMTRVMYLNYDPEATPAELFEEHRRFGAAFRDAVPPVPRRRDHDRDPERRLRIGYLSPDLRTHSVAYFVAPVFEAFDRERFDVVAYAHLTSPDRVTEHLRSLVTDWRDVTHLSDPELARRIHADRIDILVELAGLTKDSRVLACTARPAPIQIGYLGYPNGTGLPQIDYRITDHIADPEGADELYTETLIRLPRCFLAYAVPNHAPPLQPPPVERNGYVTFGSFNNLAKVNARVVRTWAEVLSAVPGSRLLLKATGTGDPGTRDYLRGAFAAAGVAPERIEFAPYAATADAHLAIYNRVDVALDTFPYNGTTTTCEALWMGVPVITLAGDRHAARVGASLLTAIGFHAGIAATAEEYVLTARLLAERPQLLAAARRSLRADMLRSPLCAARDHAAALEEAYRAVWRLWCEAG